MDRIEPPSAGRPRWTRRLAIEPIAATPSRIRRCACGVAAVLVALVALSRFDVAHLPVQTDIRFYVAYASQAADGAIPHRDFFDNKPQLATMVGAALCRAGDALGVERLLAMRTGFLVLAGIAALLLFVIQRRLNDRRCAAGLLGLLAFLGFDLLGLMPAIGPIPKLLMGILASSAARLVDRRRWVAAGALGALAAIDWQIGAFAFFGVLAGAVVGPADGRAPSRVGAAGRVILGAALATGVVLAWFAWHGALDAAFRQMVFASLARGETALESRSGGATVARVFALIRAGCGGHVWLAWVGVAGLAVYPVWLRRHLGRETAGLVVVLGVFHYGILAFSLVDFQGYGDLYAVLASLAFFAGVTLIELAGRLSALFASATRDEARGRRLARALPWGMVLAVAAALRPFSAPFVPPLEVRSAGAASLDEQRAVAAELRAAIGDRRVGFAGCAEQAYLTGEPNRLPFVFWNQAAFSHFRDAGDAEKRGGLLRQIRLADLDAIVCAKGRIATTLVASGEWERVDLRSTGGSYRVNLLLRRRPSGTARTGAGSP